MRERSHKEFDVVPLPWERNDFLKERKHDRIKPPFVGPRQRWRDLGSNCHGRVRDGGSRCRGSYEIRRPPSNDSEFEQRSWQVHPDEFDLRHDPQSRLPGDKLLEEEDHHPYLSRGGRCWRNSREDGDHVVQNCLKDHMSDRNVSTYTHRWLRDSNNNVTNEMPTYTPIDPLHSDSINSSNELVQEESRVNNNKMSNKNGGVGSLDWKPRKWNRGGLSSWGLDFSHSSSSKSPGAMESNEGKMELRNRSETPAASPSNADVTHLAFPVKSEEAIAVKKPRLNWGEGLKKYERKKVEDLGVGASHAGGVSCKVEVSHFQNSSCPSPATPSTACSSSPGLMEKTFGTALNIDADARNFYSHGIGFQSHLKNMSFDLENLDISSVANSRSSLIEMLQYDRHGLAGSSFPDSTAANKFLEWKSDILKALEIIESEIDLLENELYSLASECGSASPAGLVKPCVRQDAVSRPAPPPPPPPHAVPPYRERMLGAYEDLPLAVGVGVGVGMSVDATDSSACVFTDGSSIPAEDCNLCERILDSNKDSAGRASDAFSKLLGGAHRGFDCSRVVNGLVHDNNALVEEKVAARQQSLRFMERVITLKYKVFQHLWKEDMRLLCTRKCDARAAQKKWDLNMRTPQSGHQKYRSSIRSRFSSPAGNLSLVPTAEVVEFASKLLADSRVICYRNALKMPLLILDERERMASRFVSDNGLVEDPWALEKERSMVNPWTVGEKEVFMNKLVAFGKDFGKIASSLDHKSIADCIEFYYKNHKSDSFVKVKKYAPSKPTTSYLVPSWRKTNCEISASSPGVAGMASLLAATDVANGTRSKHLPGKSQGIYGAFSSEAMGSCVTTSFDAIEGKINLSDDTGQIKCTCSDDNNNNNNNDDDDYDDDDDDESLGQSCGEMELTKMRSESRRRRIIIRRSGDCCKELFSKAKPSSAEPQLLHCDDENGCLSDMDEHNRNHSLKPEPNASSKTTCTDMTDGRESVMSVREAAAEASPSNRDDMVEVEVVDGVYGDGIENHVCGARVLIDKCRTTSSTAAGLGSDLGSIYGLENMHHVSVELINPKPASVVVKPQQILTRTESGARVGVLKRCTSSSCNIDGGVGVDWQ